MNLPINLVDDHQENQQVNPPDNQLANQQLYLVEILRENHLISPLGDHRRNRVINLLKNHRHDQQISRLETHLINQVINPVVDHHQNRLISLQDSHQRHRLTNLPINLRHSLHLSLPDSHRHNQVHNRHEIQHLCQPSNPLDSLLHYQLIGLPDSHRSSPQINRLGIPQLSLLASHLDSHRRSPQINLLGIPQLSLLVSHLDSHRRSPQINLLGIHLLNLLVSHLDSLLLFLQDSQQLNQLECRQNVLRGAHPMLPAPRLLQSPCRLHPRYSVRHSFHRVAPPLPLLKTCFTTALHQRTRHISQQTKKLRVQLIPSHTRPSLTREDP